MSGIGKAAFAGACLIGSLGWAAMEPNAGGFDSRAWKAASGSTDRKNPRSAMVEDVKRLLKPGMTRDEIVGQLGPPEIEKQGTLTYALGVGSFGVDYLYLVVRLNNSGHLATAVVSQG